MEKKEQIVETKLLDQCPECGSTNLITDYDTGEIVCGDCGFVSPEQMVDLGPEWRAFDEEQRAERTRVGAPISQAIYDKGLSTTLRPINRDAFGRVLPPKTFLEMGRLSRRQESSRVHSSIDRNFALAMSEAGRILDKFVIPRDSKLREAVAITYRKVLEKGLIRGRSIIAMVPATIYVIFRQNGITRTLQEVANVSLVDEKEVARCYRILLKELEIQMPVPDAIKYVSKIAERIGIPGKIQGRAIEILQKAKEKVKEKRIIISGKDRMGLAAAALYIACLENNEGETRSKWTQKKIAEAAEVTEVTVRNRYKDLVKKLDIKLPL